MRLTLPTSYMGTTYAGSGFLRSETNRALYRYTLCYWHLCIHLESWILLWKHARRLLIAKGTEGRHVCCERWCRGVLHIANPIYRGIQIYIIGSCGRAQTSFSLFNVEYTQSTVRGITTALWCWYFRVTVFAANVMLACSCCDETAFEHWCR